MNLRHVRPLLLVGVAALALQGCFGGLLESDGPAAESFRLSEPVPAEAPAVGVTLPVALVVARPRAPASLDTDQIAIAPGGHRFDHYTGVRWAEPMPQMLQQALVSSFTGSGRFAGVFAAPARTPAELLLDVEVRHFEAVAASAEATPEVRVQLQSSLVDARRGVRVASFVSEARVPAQDNRRAAIVAAFDRAAAEVIRDVTVRAGEAAASQPAR